MYRLKLERKVVKNELFLFGSSYNKMVYILFLIIKVK